MTGQVLEEINSFEPDPPSVLERITAETEDEGHANGKGHDVDDYDESEPKGLLGHSQDLELE